jgi:hypothetical protein
MYHLSICTTVGGARVGLVVSGRTEAEAVRFAETFPDRVGYCGNGSFSEAVTRAGMMERDVSGAWGPVSLWAAS